MLLRDSRCRMGLALGEVHPEYATIALSRSMSACSDRRFKRDPSGNCEAERSLLDAVLVVPECAALVLHGVTALQEGSALLVHISKTFLLRLDVRLHVA